MTCTTPCRRITLHFSHMGFTDALTFMSSSLDERKQTTRRRIRSESQSATRACYLNRYVILPRCRS